MESCTSSSHLAWICKARQFCLSSPYKNSVVRSLDFVGIRVLDGRGIRRTSEGLFCRTLVISVNSSRYCTLSCTLSCTHGCTHGVYIVSWKQGTYLTLDPRSLDLLSLSSDWESLHFKMWDPVWDISMPNILTYRHPCTQLAHNTCMRRNNVTLPGGMSLVI